MPTLSTNKSSLRLALANLLHALEDDRTRQELYKAQIDAAYAALQADDRVVVWIDQDGSVVEPYIYTDLDYPIYLFHIDSDPHNEQRAEKAKTEPLIEILAEDEVKLCRKGTIATKGDLQVLSTFHDYQIRLLSPYGDMVESRGMGDGVDQYADHEGNSISPGTVAYQLATMEYLEHSYSDVLEAYYPDAEAKIATWIQKHADDEVPF